MKYYAGIEGGSTTSYCVIVNKMGEIVGESHAGGSNINIIGLEKLVQIIKLMIKQAKHSANIDDGICLNSLGLCLSGVESQNISDLITIEIEKTNIAEKIITKNDLISAGLASGGYEKTVFIQICGTGSNSGVMSMSEMICTTGGMGYLLGEKGSAYWLSHKVLKLVVKYMNDLPINYEFNNYLTELIDSVKNFFKFHTVPQLISQIYNNYSTDRIAAFSKKICQLANSGNNLCVNLVRKIGYYQAILLVTNIRKTRKILQNQFENNQITVLCIGSVWKSFNIFKDTFYTTLYIHEPSIKPKLVKFVTSSVLGSALLASPNSFIYNPNKYLTVLD